MDICIAYEITFYYYTECEDFTWGIFLLGAVSWRKIIILIYIIYSEYGNGFDVQGRFLLSDGIGFWKNVLIFDADMSSQVHIDNRKKH